MSNGSPTGAGGVRESRSERPAAASTPPGEAPGAGPDGGRDTAFAPAAVEGAGGERLARPGASVARKLLALVIGSALVPALLVGLVSYLTAREILVDKIHGALDARLAACEEHLDLSLARRVEDAEIFANAFIVGATLDASRRAALAGLPEAADSTRQQLRSYLDEVAGRYRLYRELAVVDVDGRTIASTAGAAGGGWRDRLAPTPESRKGVTLETGDGEPLAVVRQAVNAGDGERLGSLIAVGGLEDIWQRLRAEVQPERARLLVVAATGQALFDSAREEGAPPRAVGSEGVRRALVGMQGVAEYRDAGGVEVVASFRYSRLHQLGLVIEQPAGEAFVALTRMRQAVVWISVLATLLVTAIGAFLALNLTRPIDALSEGARLVAAGDLSTEVPATTGDQIGDLTRTFNRMVRTLRESRETLENLSVTDDLTGLYNRRYMRRRLDEELARARRAGQALSILILDLDEFKAFNDLLGHLQGDLFLRRTAEILKAGFRPSDVLSRWGGEEFVAMLPETGKREAARVAERVRAAFEARSPVADLAPRVTISAGLATYPDDGETREELLLNADVALYRAKDLGRNRIEMSSLPRAEEDEG
ncbi:MAG: diguanylate cyclase [Acidobacteriota bacterium]|nr:diguanylate cyclase [Acidobacteriota bacterium]MDH3523341.1 diguanylate cyclase [Acidobacteriota bacterium]